MSTSSMQKDRYCDTLPLAHPPQKTGAPPALRTVRLSAHAQWRRSGRLRRGGAAARARTCTCVDGKVDVRSVSCVSSNTSREGMLSTKAAWCGVAAHAVMR
jgi:hypothetical protein